MYTSCKLKKLDILSVLICSIEFDRDCDFFAIAGVTMKIKVKNYCYLEEQIWCIILYQMIESLLKSVFMNAIIFLFSDKWI